MESRKFTYESDGISISYDLNRCIHAAECMKGLREVFDPQKKPWIQPEKAEPSEITEIVPRCPTGALHYTLKNSGGESAAPPEGEKMPATNSISVTTDGPLYLRGDIRVEDHEGAEILQDTRLALCRCGYSENKPACDNSHGKEEFEAPAAFRTDTLKDKEGNEKGNPLLVRIMENGPSIVEGNFVLYSDTMQPRNINGRLAFCRCGASGNKPFCDGSHREVGFQG